MNAYTLDPAIGHPNATLDEDQTLRIGARLENAQDKLQMVDHELALLLAHRARIADRVYRCNVALAPYKKLPVEIIREIILIVVGAPHDFPLRKEITLDPRLQITQVCIDWRQIAFDTPELWNLKFAHLPGSSAAQLAGAWWSQCSGSQLSLVIEDDILNLLAGIRSTSVDDNFLFEHIITPHSSRLVTLQMDVGAGTVIKLLALPAGSFKAIRSVGLCVDPSGSPTYSLAYLDYDLNTAFSLCPHLSSMSVITTDADPIDPWMLHMSWSQLTDLSLSVPEIPADRILLLLSECPLLCQLWIISIKDIDADTVTQISATCPTPLCLANLNTLSITFSSPANHTHFLRALSLPKLSILLLFRCGFMDCPPSTYTAFFQSVGSTLKAFEIQDAKHRQTETVPSFQVDKTLFSGTPHLISCTLPLNYYIGPLALEEIADGGLLPSVTSMELGIQDPESLVRMLEIRLSRARESEGKICMIRKVLFRCPDPNVDFKFKDRLDALWAWGVNVVISP